jgi:hypothetical protein
LASILDPADVMVLLKVDLDHVFRHPGLPAARLHVMDRVAAAEGVRRRQRVVVSASSSARRRQRVVVSAS